MGAELRGARRQHGLSLDELSAPTKISVERLKAIEDEDVDELPPLVYLRRLVHTYAAEVGLDPSETFKRYLHASISRHSASSRQKSREKHRTFSTNRRAQTSTSDSRSATTRKCSHRAVIFRSET